MVYTWPRFWGLISLQKQQTKEHGGRVEDGLRVYLAQVLGIDEPPEVADHPHVGGEEDGLYLARVLGTDEPPEVADHPHGGEAEDGQYLAQVLGDD